MFLGMELKVLMPTKLLKSRLKNGFQSLSRICLPLTSGNGEGFLCHTFIKRKDDSSFEKLILPP